MDLTIIKGLEAEQSGVVMRISVCLSVGFLVPKITAKFELDHPLRK